MKFLKFHWCWNQFLLGPGLMVLAEVYPHCVDLQIVSTDPDLMLYPITHTSLE
jgi:hypothetical protein